jgi:hypothetical protein
MHNYNVGNRFTTKTKIGNWYEEQELDESMVPEEEVIHVSSISAKNDHSLPIGPKFCFPTFKLNTLELFL